MITRFSCGTIAIDFYRKHLWLCNYSSFHMEFLLRFVQIHETFRKPEIEALAVVEDINAQFLAYSEIVSQCSLNSSDTAPTILVSCVLKTLTYCSHHTLLSSQRMRQQQNLSYAAASRAKASMSCGVQVIPMGNYTQMYANERPRNGRHISHVPFVSISTPFLALVPFSNRRRLLSHSSI